MANQDGSKIEGRFRIEKQEGDLDMRGYRLLLDLEHSKFLYVHRHETEVLLEVIDSDGVRPADAQTQLLFAALSLGFVELSRRYANQNAKR